MSLQPLFREFAVERVLIDSFEQGHPQARQALHEYCGARNLVWGVRKGAVELFSKVATTRVL